MGGWFCVCVSASVCALGLEVERESRWGEGGRRERERESDRERGPAIVGGCARADACWLVTRFQCCGQRHAADGKCGNCRMG